MEATVHGVMCLFFLLLYLFSVQMPKVIKKMLLKYTSTYALLLVVLEYVVLIYTGTHLNHFNGGFHDNSSKLLSWYQNVKLYWILLQQEIMEVAVVTARTYGRAKLDSDHHRQHTNTNTWARCSSFCLNYKVKALKACVAL